MENHINDPWADHINDPWADLHKWWMLTAQHEIEPLISKAQEYGGARRAGDLAQIGHQLVQTGVKGNPENEAEMQELGIYFYIIGKIARWTAAISEGRPVSDDTLHDIGIYIRMVQRIRDAGGWPV